MIDVTHWYYPQILTLIWFAWRLTSQTRKCLSMEHRRQIRAKSNAQEHLSDNTLATIENIAAPLAVISVYGPPLMFLYLGGFFS